MVVDIKEFLPEKCFFQASIVGWGYFLILAQATEKCYFVFWNYDSSVSFFIWRAIIMQTHPTKYVSQFEMKGMTHLGPCNWSTVNRDGEDQDLN